MGIWFNLKKSSKSDFYIPFKKNEKKFDKFTFNDQKSMINTKKSCFLKLKHMCLEV